MHKQSSTKTNNQKVTKNLKNKKNVSKKIKKNTFPNTLIKRTKVTTSQSHVQQNIPTTTHGGRPLRVAHMTDLHFFSKQQPSFAQLMSKRTLGYLNLILLGRRNHFSDKARHNTIQKIDQMNPDLIICTGDLASTGLDVEFDEAYTALKPLTDKYPFVLIPGNHDVYTDENAKELSLAQRFSSFMHTVFPKTLKHKVPVTDKKSTNDTKLIKKDIPNTEQMLATTQDNLVSPELQQRFPTLTFFLTKTKSTPGAGANSNDTYALVIGLNPCRAIFTASTGEYPEEQLKQLAEVLNLDENSKLFFDAKSNKRVKPFIVLATHYPLIDRRGADYTGVNPKHGAVNNHVLLSILDNSKIKPGLIIHGHDHLGAATGIVTQRIKDTATNIGEMLKQKIPNKVKTPSEFGSATLTNLSIAERFQWKYDNDGKPIAEFNIPTVKDITHSYSNIYNTDTNQSLQQHLVDRLVEQHTTHRSRNHIKNVKFKEMDLVSGFFSLENLNAITHQHGSYFHVSAPLKLSNYLQNKMKPFGVATAIPRQYSHLRPKFYDNVSKHAHNERIKSKIAILEQYYNQNPQHKNQYISIEDEAIDLALREERESIVVDISTQTELSPNHTVDVVIPIHNPGSGALAGTYCKTLLDWPKFAGFNMYSLQQRSTPLPMAKNSPSSYVTSDYHTLGIEHCIQDHNLEFPKQLQQSSSSSSKQPLLQQSPYTYPMRQ